MTTHRPGACREKRLQAVAKTHCTLKVTEVPNVHLASSGAQVPIGQHNEEPPLVAHWHYLGQSLATVRLHLLESDLCKMRHSSVVQLGGKMNF